MVEDPSDLGVVGVDGISEMIEDPSDLGVVGLDEISDRGVKES